MGILSLMQDSSEDDVGRQTRVAQHQPDDDQLIKLYLSGDRDAFDTLYERHRSAVYRFFVRQLPDDQANDAFQDTWTKLIDNVDRYQPQGKFMSYLFTIAHNVLNDLYRQQMRQLPTNSSSNSGEHQINNEVEPKASIDSEPDALTDRTQLAHKLVEELKKLPINQRAVWLMQQESGLSLKEIAELTDSTLEGVKSRLRYARNSLKAGMQKYV